MQPQDVSIKKNSSSKLLDQSLTPNGVKETEKPNTLPNFSSASSRNLVKKYLKILLVLVVVMAIIVVASIAYQRFFKREHLPTVNFEELTYPSLLWKDRVIKNAQTAASETVPEKRFELYRKIFADLLAVYISDHNIQTREKLESLQSFISTEFADLYDDQSFIIPCLDSACGQATYPSQIDEIRNDLKNASAIDPTVLQGVEDKFEAAAISKEPDYQWQNYLGAFQEIKSEVTRTKDETLRQLGIRLSDFLKSTYASQYSRLQKQDPNVLEI